MFVFANHMNSLFYFILFFYTRECAVGLAGVFHFDNQRMGKFKIPKPPVHVLESKACKPACTGKWGSGHASGGTTQPTHIHGSWKLQRSELHAGSTR